MLYVGESKHPRKKTRVFLKYEVLQGTRDAAHAQSTYAQQGSNDKNVSFKNIADGRGCLLSPTYSTSEDKVSI